MEPVEIPNISTETHEENVINIEKNTRNAEKINIEKTSVSKRNLGMFDNNKRIQSEIQQTLRHRDDFTAELIKDRTLRVTFNAPEDSVYSIIPITIYVCFRDDHPFRSPRIVFLPKIFHPNIDEQGCTYYFDRIWSPAITVVRIVKQIKYLLKHPEKQDPSLFKDLFAEGTTKEQYKGQHKGKEEEEGAKEEEFLENPFAMEIWHNEELLREMIISTFEVNN